MKSPPKPAIRAAEKIVYWLYEARGYESDVDDIPVLQEIIDREARVSEMLGVLEQIRAWPCVLDGKDDCTCECCTADRICKAEVDESDD
jgi:hypothetical protein